LDEIVEDVMAVNSITGDVTAFKLPSLNSAVSLDQPVKVVSAINDPPSNQTVQSSAAVNANNKVSPVNKQSQDAGIESRSKPVRTMNSVVESYNQQGKVRIKFMDSNNNVIYQIPAEMVAKMEDQMMKPETATNIKG
jgi:hypothetical protein